VLRVAAGEKWFDPWIQVRDITEIARHARAFWRERCAKPGRTDPFESAPRELPSRNSRLQNLYKHSRRASRRWKGRERDYSCLRQIDFMSPRAPASVALPQFGFSNQALDPTFLYSGNAMSVATQP